MQFFCSNPIRLPNLHLGMEKRTGSVLIFIRQRYTDDLLHYRLICYTVGFISVWTPNFGANTDEFLGLTLTNKHDIRHVAKTINL